MKISNLKKLKSKDLIVFDLDGTLAETKSVMDTEMEQLMARLLAEKKVAVIGGGRYEMFRYQMLNHLKISKVLLKNLFLFPTTSSAFYRYNNGWKKVYSRDLTKQQKNKIRKAFQIALKQIGYKTPKKLYGQVIEDRHAQLTWSAVGQDVVSQLGRKRGIALKEKWKRNNTPLKLKITRLVGKLLPDLEVRAAAYTSIDVTHKGVDKAYGLREIEKILKVKIGKMLFVGDSIFPGGNDYAVTKTPVDYVKVVGPKETKKVIRQLLAK